jgi:hypothetical protein
MDVRRPPSEIWSATFARLVREESGEGPTCDRDECWSVSFSCAMTRVDHVLAMLPGGYDRIFESWEEMCDWSGECVEFESETGVWACDAENAIFSYTAHWQAGLWGSVTVYPNADSYRAAREHARRDEELSDDSDPGG